MADAAHGAADRAGAAIDEAMCFISASNQRIASMEAKATAENCQIEGRGSELTDEALLMSVTDHVWNALMFIGQLEGKVKIESLTERMIRLETQPDLVLRPAMAEHIQEWDSLLEFLPK